MSETKTRTRGVLRSELPDSPRPYHFTQYVPEPGFQWVRGHSPIHEGPRWHDDGETETDLTALDPVEEWALVCPPILMPLRGGGGVWFDYSGPVRSRTPLADHAGLFREFAALDPSDRDAILRFANQHGNLGVEALFFPTDIPPELLHGLNDQEVRQVREYVSGRRRRGDVRLTAGRAIPNLYVKWSETHGRWVSEICTMHRTIAIWEMIEQRDLEGLSKIVTHEADGRGVRGGTFSWFIRDAFAEVPDPKQPQLGTEKRHVIAFAESATPDVTEMFEVARQHVLLEVNRSLWRRVQPVLSLDPTTKMPVLRMYPDDLLRAMWVQFAEAVAGGKEFRRCVCRKWFEVATEVDGRYARRLFCSDACKSRDYRQRKAEQAETASAKGKKKHNKGRK